MKRNHDYFWSFVISHYPDAIEEHYYDGIELDFWPSREAMENDDGSWKNCCSCHHDLNTGELKIYTDF